MGHFMKMQASVITLTMVLLLGGLSITVQAQAASKQVVYQLYIHYCKDVSAQQCERIENQSVFGQKAIMLLQQRGLEIVSDDVETDRRVVLEFLDSCAPIKICELRRYQDEAMIRIQNPHTYETYEEKNVLKRIWPISSKALLSEVVSLLVAP